MILVIFAVPTESQDFRRRVRAVRLSGGDWEGRVGGSATIVRIVHCGVGAAAAARIVPQHIAAHAPEFVIAAGFAGALVPELAIGDVVVDENVSAPELLRPLLKGSKSIRFGSIVSVDSPAETVAAKRELATGGALAVDMETAAIATACRAAGVPLLAARSISDRATEPLPVPFAVWFDLARQRPRILPLLGYLASHPTKIPAFARFVRDLRPAREALASFLLLATSDRPC